MSVFVLRRRRRGSLGRSIFYILETRGTDLAETGELLEAGKVRPLVDSVWALEQFEQAFGRVDSGKARGQVVIKVSGDAG